MARYRSLYEVLGVGADCDLAELKRAFNARVKELHPDLHHDLDDVARDSLTEEMQLVNEAWQTLRDSDRRRAYDSVRAWELSVERGRFADSSRQGMGLSFRKRWRRSQKNKNLPPLRSRQNRQTSRNDWANKNADKRPESDLRNKDSKDKDTDVGAFRNENANQPSPEIDITSQKTGKAQESSFSSPSPIAPQAFAFDGYDNRFRDPSGESLGDPSAGQFRDPSGELFGREDQQFTESEHTAEARRAFAQDDARAVQDQGDIRGGTAERKWEAVHSAEAPWNAAGKMPAGPGPLDRVAGEPGFLTDEQRSTEKSLRSFEDSGVMPVAPGPLDEFMVFDSADSAEERDIFSARIEPEESLYQKENDFEKGSSSRQGDPSLFSLPDAPPHLEHPHLHKESSPSSFSSFREDVETAAGTQKNDSERDKAWRQRKEEKEDRLVPPLEESLSSSQEVSLDTPSDIEDVFVPNDADRFVSGEAEGGTPTPLDEEKTVEKEPGAHPPVLSQNATAGLADHVFDDTDISSRPLPGESYGERAVQKQSGVRPPVPSQDAFTAGPADHVFDDTGISSFEGATVWMPPPLVEFAEGEPGDVFRVGEAARSDEPTAGAEEGKTVRMPSPSGLFVPGMPGDVAQRDTYRPEVRPQDRSEDRPEVRPQDRSEDRRGEDPGKSGTERSVQETVSGERQRIRPENRAEAEDAAIREEESFAMSGVTSGVELQTVPKRNHYLPVPIIHEKPLAFNWVVSGFAVVALLIAGFFLVDKVIYGGHEFPPEKRKIVLPIVGRATVVDMSAGQPYVVSKMTVKNHVGDLRSMSAVTSSHDWRVFSAGHGTNGHFAMWNSEDGGKIWTRYSPTVFNGSAPREITALAAHGETLLAGGSVNRPGGGSSVTVWMSDKNRQWESHAGSDAFLDIEGEAEITAVAIAPGTGRMVAVGRNNTDAAAWFSQGGKQWFKADGQGLFGGPEVQRMFDVVVRPDGMFVAVGESAGRVAAWFSLDGRNWKRLPLDPLVFSPGTKASALAVWPDGALAIVGDDSATGAGAVWFSLDTRSWRRVNDAQEAFTGEGPVHIEDADILLDGTLVAVGHDAVGALLWISEGEITSDMTGNTGWVRVPAHGEKDPSRSAQVPRQWMRSVVALPNGDAVVVGNEGVASTEVFAAVWRVKPAKGWKFFE